MEIPYRLIRSDRRTLSLTVESGGAFVARAPLRMPVGEIEAFIERKRAWIERKRAEAPSRPAPFAPRDGACLPWVGGELRLAFCGLPLCVDFDGWLLVPRDGDALARLRDWRKRRAAEVLTPRVHLWESRMGLRVQSIHYTSARRRWGSMSADGRLRLNAALMHCPHEHIPPRPLGTNAHKQVDGPVGKQVGMIGRNQKPIRDGHIRAVGHIKGVLRRQTVHALRRVKHVHEVRSSFPNGRRGSSFP